MRALIVAWVFCGLAATAAGAAEPGSRPLATGPDPPPQVLVLLNLPAAHFRADGNYSGGYADVAGSSARRRIATALARAHGLSLVTDWPMPILGPDCYVMELPAERHPDDVAARLARDPRVAWAQAMNLFRPLAHDDPLFSLQPAAREWQLDALHAAATGRDVRIAVIDSAVQLDHPDLFEQVAVSANFAGKRTYQAKVMAPRWPESSPRVPTTTWASPALRRTPVCWRCAHAGRRRRPRPFAPL